MTAQAYLNAGTRAQSAGATTLTPALPGSRVSGNSLFAQLSSKNNATHSCSDPSWTKIGQWNSGASFTASLWVAKVTGAEAAPVFTWSGSVACGAQVMQFTRDDENTAIVGTVGTAGTGTTSTHTSSGFNTTAANSRVAYFDWCAANTALGAPSGWTEHNDDGSATGASRDVVGSKLVASSGGASGNISVTGGAAAWVQVQVELLEPLFAGSTFIVSSDSDNGEETNNATWSTSFIDQGLDSGNGYNLGVRFQGVTVPQAAAIVSAKLRLVSAGFAAGTYGSIYGDKVGNAAAWSSSSRPSQITKTTSSTAAPAGAADTVLFVDVTAQLQEIVNLGGWASGNAVRFGGDYTGATGIASYYSYNNDPAKAAQLLVEYTTGGGGTTGTANITEGADTAASTGALAVKGTASPTEANDTSSATSKIAIAASLAANEQDDTLSAAGAGLSPIAGTASITEADDALAASSAIKLAGALAAVEADDAIAASARLAIAGALAAAEADDTATATGAVQIQGVGIATEGADTLASTSALTITATAAISEGSDTASGAASLVAKGVLAVTEAADAVSATGALAITAQAALTDDDDATVGSSALRIEGSLTVTEQGDTLAATSGNYKLGELAVIEADDALASSGLLPIAGAATISEAGDTAASTGTLPITATASVTEAGDTVTAFAGRSGKLDVTEQDDTLSASGVFTIRGTAAIVEEMDTTTSSGRLVISGEGAANDNDDWLGAEASLGLVGAGEAIEADDTVEGVVRLGKRLPFSGTARNVTTYMDRSGATIVQPRNGTSPRPRNAATAVTIRNAASVRMPR